jgi:hypothetical protein
MIVSCMHGKRKIFNNRESVKQRRNSFTALQIAGFDRLVEFQKHNLSAR